MKNSYTVPISVLLFLIFPVASVFSQNTPPTIEGTITSIEKTGFTIKLSDGTQKKIITNDKTRFIRREKTVLSMIKAGDALGVTSVPGSDNVMIAKAINIFPSGMLGRIRNGQFPMGDSGNTMTNAEVIQFTAAVNGRMLKMKITEGISDILVPEDVPIMRMILLKPGDLKIKSAVHVRGQTQPNGSITSDFVEIVQ
jgi:hypothetical protein